MSATELSSNNKNTPLHLTLEPSKHLSMEEGSQEVNLLLLGEKGVGKSTFINAFVNYLAFNSLEDVVVEKLIPLMSTKFTVTFGEFATKVVQFGDSPDGVIEESSTESAKSYLFYLNGKKIRLIDTPGLGNKVELEQNDTIFDNILDYIREFKKLHAICIFVESKESTDLKKGIKYLLSKFERTAANNIIFVFPHPTDKIYLPGNPVPVLKIALDEIYAESSVQISFDCKNVFRINSATFQYLLAMYNSCNFSEYEQAEFKRNWKMFSEESVRMILYITDGGFKSLTSYRIQNVIMINEVRRFMRQLAKLTINIGQIVRDISSVLETKKILLVSHKQDRDRLILNLYTPFINIRRQPVNDTILVCTSSRCRDSYNVNGVVVVHYRQRCLHNICFSNGFPEFGSDELCNLCRCAKQDHMFVNYESQIYPDQQVDANIQSQISTKEGQIQVVEKSLEDSQKTAKELKKELKFFMKLILTSQYLLNHLCITSSKDEYEAYLLENNKSLEKSPDGDYLTYFQDMLELYKKQKNAADEYLQWWKSVEGSVVSAAEVQNLLSAVEAFKKLPHFQEIIKKSVDTERLKNALEEWLKTE